MRKKNKWFKGSRLEDGSAHDRHHTGMGRRDFLTNLGLLSAGSIALSGLPVNRLLGAPMLAQLFNNSGDRVLVVIRLKGGNDGLNTFVPVFDYSTYASYRPNLKIDQADLLSLNSKYSIPNSASSLLDMWNDGQMKVIQNVGYDDMDLSHFVSTDIWDSAVTGTGAKSGWLGRYLWDQNPDYFTQPPDDPLAIQIGGDGNILFFNEENTNMALNVVNPDELYQIAQSGSLYAVNGNATCYYDDQLDFMKSMINTTFKQSESIHDAYDAGSNSVTFPAERLGQGLSLVSRLIKGGLQTKIYMLTLDGFDTHAQQDVRHPELLTQFADSVKAFFADLAADNKDQNALCMTFSEFGRRVNDNFSLGTDHGTAAPLMMFGPALDGNGILGDDVDLSDLDHFGNLKYDIDFRQVYTTVLQDWLCADELTADTVLGSSFSKLALGFQCLDTAVPEYQTKNNLHQLRYDNGTPFIYLSLKESANVKLEVYDVVGKRVVSTNNDYYRSGTHQIPIPGVSRWTPGAYVYKLYINGKMESGKLIKQ